MDQNELEAVYKNPVRSRVGYLSSFELDKLPLTEVSILSSFEERIWPTYNVCGTETKTLVEFVIPPSSLYTCLNMQLFISGKMVTTTGASHTATDGYAPAQNAFPHAIRVF